MARNPRARGSKIWRRAAWLARTVAPVGFLVGLLAVLATMPRCNQQYALLLTIKATSFVETFDLRVRERGDKTAMGKVVLERVGQPVDKTGVRDISQPGESLTISVTFDKPGNYVVYVLGHAGQGSSGRQYALRDIQISGVEELSLTLQPLTNDKDGDGYPACSTPNAPTKFLDCDDNNPDVHPFAKEICGNKIDDDCSAQCNALPTEGDAKCVDNDGDGVPAPADCDDNDPCRAPTISEKPNFCDTKKTEFPQLPKACLDKLAREGKTATAPFCGDGIDQDCNGQDLSCKTDEDCDGVPPPEDCNDKDPKVNPSAKEICGDGIDNNCNKIVDEGCAPCDVDGDGHAAPTAGADCKDDKGQPLPKDDPDDFDSGVHPKVTADTNGNEGGTVLGALRGFCRDVPDKNGVSVRKIDHDGDGKPAEQDGCPTKACDQDGDGFQNASCNPPAALLDCNDNNPQIFPGAPDICGDGIKQNCISDTACSQIVDKDGDKYADSVDCDDNNPNVHPWAKEVCDSVDNDCDGLIDEGNPDSSGALIPTNKKLCNDNNAGECGGGNSNCSPTGPDCSPAGRALSGVCACSRTKPKSVRDENNRVKCSAENLSLDASARCFGATQPQNERCDNRDWDCNGRADDPTGANPFVDKGKPCGTSVGNCKAGVVTGCDLSRQLPNASLVASVLKAQNIEFNPNWVCGPAAGETQYWLPRSEVCNGKDDDCNGSIPNNEVDGDGDKYLGCSGCNGTAQYALATGLLGCGDCNTGLKDVYPGAPEQCNDRDDNCTNGKTDDGATQCTGSTPTCCSGQRACRNLQNDRLNCNRCGNVCSSVIADRCENGRCVCGAGGSACGAGLNCVNGQCRCIQNGRCTGCCQGNVCRAGTAVGQCGVNGAACQSCNDGIECTTDSCNSNGTCSNTNRGSTAICQAGAGRCLGGSCCTACIGGGQCRSGTTNQYCGANNTGTACGTCSATSADCQSATCATGSCVVSNTNEGVANSCNSSSGTCRSGACCAGARCWSGSACRGGTGDSRCGSGGENCSDCSSTGRTCSGGNCVCNGCTSGAQCYGGTGSSNNSTCGTGGGSCTDCTATGQTCNGSGTCVCGGCFAGASCEPGTQDAACGSGGGSCNDCTNLPGGGTWSCTSGSCVCQGCLQGGTNCRTGTNDNACGSGGGSCTDCGSLTGPHSCQSGSCVCTGCVDGSSVCQDGTADTACGTGGAACSDCTASGQTCQSNACST